MVIAMPLLYNLCSRQRNDPDSNTFFLPQPTPDIRDTSIKAVETFLTLTVLLMIF